MGLSCKRIKEKILKDYPEVRVELSETNTHAEGNTIYLAEDDYNPTTMVDVFNILHEIGHVFTNEPEDTRAEREWMATTWAIFHMKRYGIRIPQWRKDNFQDDIYKWYDIERNVLKKKHKMTKAALKLRWRD